MSAWLRYLRGYDFQGNPLLVEDVRSRALTTLAKVGQNDPRALLGLREVFGDLGEDDALALELCLNLRDLDRSRVPGVLRDHLTYRPVERTAAE